MASSIKVLDMTVTSKISVNVSSFPKELQSSLGAAKSVDLVSIIKLLADDNKKISASAADKLYRTLDIKIAKIFGAKGALTATGRGFSPDILVTEQQNNLIFKDIALRKIQLSLAKADAELFKSIFLEEGQTNVEIKSIALNKKQLATGPIKIAGGEGISLSDVTTSQRFFGNEKEIPAADINEAFRKLRNSLNDKDIISIIDSTPFLRKNFLSKAQKIVIPYNNNGKVGLKAIILEWEHIKAFANFTVIDSRLQVKYPQKFINDILRTIQTETAKSSIYIDNSQYNIEYLAGSIIVKNVNNFLDIKAPTIKQKKDTTQQFISSAQWTALVQKRLGDTMLRAGEPAAPNLKERSGRFRASVQIIANYRTNLLQYSYNPFLDSLQAYGYRPDLQVARATREVAQQLYARKFNIIRNPSQ